MLYDRLYDKDSLSTFSICLPFAFFFLIFLVPVIFRVDYPFTVMRPSQIKFTGLHPGVRGRYLCPKPKFQNPFFVEYSWLVIWYNVCFEGGQLCDTKSPCLEARMP